MAWEWVSPVSAAGGASVGAVTTWLAGRGARRDAAALARTERQQQRFADAYVELLEIVEHFGQWAHTVSPVMDFGQDKHPLPSPERQARVRALVAAYGSTEVKRLHQQYHDVIGKIVGADEKIGLARRQSGTELARTEPELWEELGLRLRPAEIAARAELGNQVSDELKGKQ